jgi:hypothetical protein
MLNSQSLNSQTLNYGVTPAPDAGVVSYTDNSLEPYRLQLHDPDGELIAILNGWTAGTWERKVNEPEVLEFVHSVADDLSTNQSWAGLLTQLVYPNFVYLFEGDSTSSKQRFRIMETEYTLDVSSMLRVKCYSILEQLGREFVVNYSTQGEEDETDPGKTVTQVVQALLANQFQNNTVTLRSIAPSIGNMRFYGKFENKTILQCLRELVSIYGGYLTTDNNRRLTWSSYTGVGEGHRISLDLNAIQIRKRIDYTELANNIGVAGAGVTNDTRVGIFVHDPTSIAQYGLITTILKDQSITSLEAAEELAEKELERRKQPRIYYDVDCIDMSKVQNPEDWAYEARAFIIGQKVKIIGREVEFDTHVQSITIDLMEPAGVEISVSNPEVGTGLANINSVDVVDGDTIEEIVAEIADMIDTLQGDRGELESVRKSLDPIPEDLTAIVTWDEVEDAGNLPEKTTDMLNIDYGEIEEIDDVKDAIVNTFLDALTDPANPNYDTAKAAIVSISPKILFCQVQQVYGDFLECRLYDQVTQSTFGPVINVAKPYLLQQSTFAAQTVTYIDGEAVTYNFDTEFPEYKRNHDNGIESADFYVTPNYYVGEIITAVECFYKIGSTEYEYLEFGTGRYWAQR